MDLINGGKVKSTMPSAAVAVGKVQSGTLETKANTVCLTAAGTSARTDVFAAQLCVPLQAPR